MHLLTQFWVFPALFKACIFVPDKDNYTKNAIEMVLGVREHPLFLSPPLTILV